MESYPGTKMALSNDVKAGNEFSAGDKSGDEDNNWPVILPIIHCSTPWQFKTIRQVTAKEVSACPWQKKKKKIASKIESNGPFSTPSQVPCNIT